MNYANKLDNLNKMENFPKKAPKLIQENLNRSSRRLNLKSFKTSHKRKFRPDGFNSKFYHTGIRINTNLYKLFSKNGRGRTIYQLIL